MLQQVPVSTEGAALASKQMQVVMPHNKLQVWALKFMGQVNHRAKEIYMAQGGELHVVFTQDELKFAR